MARPATASPLSPVRFLRDLTLVLGTVLALGWAGTRWVVRPWVVEGPSMEPTLHDGDRVLVDLWSLRGGDPSVRDVVLFEGPGGTFLVKRIAPESALPSPLPSPALPAESTLEPVFVVLGDNPGASSDSRSFGPVPRHLLRGRVVWRYWPPLRTGRIE